MKLSIVLPCLNEAANLGDVLSRIESAVRRTGLRRDEVETVVADNGSHDGSVEIAARRCDRVVRVEPRGYGAAVRGGCEAARGEWIVFVDADGTYCYEDIPRLLDATKEAGAQLGIANRFGEKFERRAMPGLHRWVGTPVLSALIRFLHRGREVRDCNSGFRCAERAFFLTLPFRSIGMEFASEQIILTVRAGGRVTHVDSGLREAREARSPALSTWRDGMRHLMLILSYAPRFFELMGLWLIVLCCVGQGAATAIDTWRIGAAEILGIHSQLLLLVAAILATHVYGMGCLLHLLHPVERMTFPTRKILSLKPEELLLVLVGLGILTAVGVGLLISHWANQGFHDLKAADYLVAFAQVVAVPFALAIVLLQAHLYLESVTRIHEIEVSEVSVAEEG